MMSLCLLKHGLYNEQSCINIEGYEHFVSNRTVRHPNAKRDSGGLIVYLKNCLISEDTFVKSVDDCIIWFKFSGHVFNLEGDVYICLCYNTPINSSREIYNEKNIFDMIQDDMVEFEAHSAKTCNFVICGDFNARTAELPDYVEHDNLELLDILPDDYVVDTPIPRLSEDKTSNEYGHDLLQFCKNTGLRIINGRLGDDAGIGKFTCIKKNGSSVVDYVLCKQGMFPLINYFVVDEPNILSDHCIVSFSLNTFIDCRETAKDEGRDLQFVYRWDNDKKQDYLDALNSDSVLKGISVIKNQLNEVTNENELNGNVNEFYTLFSGVYDPLFKRKFSSKGEIFKDNTKQQNWFDDSCHAKRSNFYNLLNIYRKNKNDENRHNMTHARTEYKGCIRKVKYAFDKLQTNKLENARLKTQKNIGNC